MIKSLTMISLLAISFIIIGQQAYAWSPQNIKFVVDVDHFQKPNIVKYEGQVASVIFGVNSTQINFTDKTTFTIPNEFIKNTIFPTEILKIDSFDTDTICKIVGMQYNETQFMQVNEKTPDEGLLLHEKETSTYWKNVSNMIVDLNTTKIYPNTGGDGYVEIAPTNDAFESYPPIIFEQHCMDYHTWIVEQFGKSVK